MPSFPTFDFPKTNVKMRFTEPVVSESLNSRFVAVPRGIHVGYLPKATTGSLTLELEPDPVHGFSCLKVGAPTPAVQVDIFTSDTVELDFTGHLQFPVYVVARATYSQSSPAQGRIFTRSTGATGPQEITVCKVDKVGDDLSVDATVPANRHPPLAFQTQAFGFMRGNATAEIAFAASVTAEIVAARDDIKNPGPPPPSQRLADRLAIDLAGDFLADNLGLRVALVQGNSKIVAGSATSANVSGSFSEVSRSVAPIQTFSAGGTESVEGAVTSPTDTTRNVCFLLDGNDNRLLDTGRHPVYGRLSYLTGALTGTLDFLNADQAVVGTGTLFTTELEEGDLILGDDGLYYEVDQINTDLSLDLVQAYQGVDASGVGSSFRRFTMSFFSRGSGAEVSHALVNPTNMSFVFPAWFRQDRSIFDARLLMKRLGEREALPESTASLRGRVLAAVNTALAGALFALQDQGGTVATNVHTLNFTGTNSTIAESAPASGVCNIEVAGETGPNGVGAVQGPDGPQGSPGFGLNALNAFEVSSGFGPGGNGHTHSLAFSGATPPLSGTLAHCVGGCAMYKGGWGPNSQWRVYALGFSGNVATIKIDLDDGSPSGAEAKLFLGASI
jgi:hypothetical protein